jgi:hypothetical protein
MGANHKQQKFYDNLACFSSSRPMLPGLHQLPLDRGCWKLMMTALIALLDRTQADSVLERIGCYLALVVIVLGVLKVVFGSCQSNAVRV